MKPKQVVMFVALAGATMVVMATMIVGLTFGLTALARVVADRWRITAIQGDHVRSVRLVCLPIALGIVSAAVHGIRKCLLARMRQKSARQNVTLPDGSRPVGVEHEQ
jgi:hypothetical protein